MDFPTPTLDCDHSPPPKGQRLDLSSPYISVPVARCGSFLRREGSLLRNPLMFFKTASIFIVLWLAFFTYQYSTDISIHMYLFPLHWTSQSLFFQLLFPFRFLLFKQCCGNHACRYMHALFCIMLLLFPQDVLFKVELLNQKGMYILNFNKFS